VTAVRLPAVLSGRFEPRRRLAALVAERDELARRVDVLQADLSAALDDLAVLRRQRNRLVQAVRSRSSLGLPPDLVALIEEEGLAE